MHDWWRRAEIESQTLLRGSAYALGDTAMWEESHGHLADSATLECARCEGLRGAASGDVRLVIQVRTGVVVRTRLPRGGRVHDERYVDEIAIGASGGFADQLYTWIQVYSEEPERLVRFDGTSTVEDVNWNQEAPAVAGSSFEWAGRIWAVDSVDPSSARYSIRLPTEGSPNCDTIYDRPSMWLAIQPWLDEHAEVRRVSRTTQFHSFVYSIPLLPAERHGVRYSSLIPVASVAWSCDETIERPARGAPPERRERHYRVHYIHPGGVTPADMSWVLLHVFHGR